MAALVTGARLDALKADVDTVLAKHGYTRADIVSAPDAYAVARAIKLHQTVYALGGVDGHAQTAMRAIFPNVSTWQARRY